MSTPRASKKTKKARRGFGRATAAPETTSAMQDKDMAAPEDCLLRFDDSEQVSFADAAHYSTVLGKTGSGKSVPPILPALGSLIHAGFAGVVLDVKENVTEQVRMLARQLGRLDDVEQL